MQLQEQVSRMFRSIRNRWNVLVANVNRAHTIAPDKAAWIRST